MYYTIYQITNLINGKLYIGKHQTEQLNDSYYGSGLLIKASLKKYGKNNFKKEILYIFDTEEEMNKKEKELINENFVSRPDTYNIGIGGEGGPNFRGRQHTDKTKHQISLSNTGRFNHLTTEGRNSIIQSNKSIERRQKVSVGLKGKPKSDQHRTNLREATKTEAFRLKASISHIGKHDGEKNSQFGTCWMTDGNKNIKIKRDEVDMWFERGYKRGRINGRPPWRKDSATPS